MVFFDIIVDEIDFISVLFEMVRVSAHFRSGHRGGRAKK
jgi:hypothetical protein